jgi:hypothetical protein
MTNPSTGHSRLERELLADVMSDINEARRLRYNPAVFLDMIARHRVVDACRRVIMELPAHQAPSGFSKLWELHRLDLTAEDTVLRVKYHPLFECSLRKRAAARLGHFRTD